MDNNLQPLDTTSENPSQELLNASIILAKALSLILEENQGIVVDVKNEENSEGVQKVIVFKNQDQIHIYNCQEDLEEGTAVKMNNIPDEPQIKE